MIGAFFAGFGTGAILAVVIIGIIIDRATREDTERDNYEK